jgi:hypothetical protein
MKLLTSMSACVGAGNFDPKPLYTSPKTGTTFTSRKMVMPMAMIVTAVGYIIADFTFLRRRAVFSRYGQSGKNFGEQSTAFTRPDHADVEPVENLGMLCQRLGEAVAAFDARADVLDRVAHHLVAGLFGQRLKRLHHGQTSIDHGGELSGKNDKIRQPDRPAGALALLAHPFLDGKHEEIPAQQGGDGGLFVLRVEGAADFPPAPGLTGDV